MLADWLTQPRASLVVRLWENSAKFPLVDVRRQNNSLAKLFTVITILCVVLTTHYTLHATTPSASILSPLSLPSIALNTQCNVITNTSTRLGTFSSLPTETQRRSMLFLLDENSDKYY